MRNKTFFKLKNLTLANAKMIYTELRICNSFINDQIHDYFGNNEITDIKPVD